MKTGSTKQLPDRRVRRTRHQLRDALVALILERGWEKVSVLDVCARADIGRSTFYTHFADKEELLLSGFDELHASLDALRLAGQGEFRFAEALVEHAKDHLRLYRAVVGKRSGQQVLRRFRDVVMRLVAADIERLDVPAEHRAAMTHYVGGGFVELLTAWLDRPSSSDHTTLAGTFRKLTRGVLSSVDANRTLRTAQR
jgi:AcrR family transcriptional regulator